MSLHTKCRKHNNNFIYLFKCGSTRIFVDENEQELPELGHKMLSKLKIKRLLFVFFVQMTACTKTCMESL
jgi:hypothetical protein